MSESMKEKLSELRLTKPEFVVTDIETDFQNRLELDASLDTLVGTTDAPSPEQFDPAEAS